MKVMIQSLLFVVALIILPLRAEVYTTKSFFHADTFTQALRPFEDVYVCGDSLGCKEISFTNVTFWSYFLWFISTIKDNDIRLQRIYDAIRLSKKPSKSWRKQVYVWFAGADPQDQFVFIDTLKNKEAFSAFLQKIAKDDRKRKEAAQSEEKRKERFEMWNNSPSHRAFASTL